MKSFNQIRNVQNATTALDFFLAVEATKIGESNGITSDAIKIVSPDRTIVVIIEDPRCVLYRPLMSKVAEYLTVKVMYKNLEDEYDMSVMQMTLPSAKAFIIPQLM